MRAFFRSLAAIAAAAVAVLLGTSCTQNGSQQQAQQSGQQQNASGKTKLTLWHYFSEEQGKPFQALIDKFKAANPDIEVTSYFQGRPFELRQKLDAAFATNPGTNPTISTVYENWTSAFVTRDLMEAVEDYVGKPEGLKKEDLDDIVKAYREANSYNGKMVTLPFAKSVYMMYLNMDKLEKAGITTAPKSLDEWTSMVEKATEKQGSRVVSYGAGIQPQNEAFTTLYLARGAEFFDKDGNPIFDGPDGVAVLAALQALSRPGNKMLYIDPNYMSTPFQNQLIASYMYSSASLPYNKKATFKYATAPIPGAGQGNGKAVMQGMNLGVFKNRPEAEKKAAMRLLSFLTQTENGVFWETSTGYMPVRYSALKEKAMTDYMAKDPHYAAASSLVLSDKGKQEPKMAEWDGIRNDITTVVDRVLNRGTDPQQELTTLKNQVAERLKKK